MSNSIWRFTMKSPAPCSLPPHLPRETPLHSFCCFFFLVITSVILVHLCAPCHLFIYCRQARSLNFLAPFTTSPFTIVTTFTFTEIICFIINAEYIRNPCQGPHGPVLAPWSLLPVLLKRPRGQHSVPSVASTSAIHSCFGRTENCSSQDSFPSLGSLLKWFFLLWLLYVK